MKRLFFCFMLVGLFTLNNAVFAACPSHSNCNRSHYHSHSSRSSSTYIIRRDYSEDEHKFTNCDKHILRTETTVNYYSDGTRRTYKVHSILNNDGSVLESGCSDVKHIIHDNQHYFLVGKGKKYKIMDSDGTQISRRNYTKLKEISPDRILARVDKQYGIIDLKEKTVVPLKYKSMEQVGTNLFITKLNGYYGILNTENNILLKNEYDKIKPLYDTYLLKKYGKYGLADMDGKIIFDTDYKKIKKLGEYILVKQDKRVGVLDSGGNIICPIKYKKIRLNRNNLEGLSQTGSWHAIQNQEINSNFTKEKI